jgi:hypothetical protein
MIKRTVLLPTLLCVAGAVCSQPAGIPDMETYLCLVVDEPKGHAKVDGLGEQINAVRESTSRLGERKK